MAAQSHGRKKREHHEEHPDERWLLTYADMITLLMVLFIVMFAVSQVDQKKFAELSGGLAVGFGGEAPGLAGGSGVLPGDTSVTGQSTVSNTAVAPGIAQASASGTESRAKTVAAADRARLAVARDALQAALDAAGLTDRASLELTDRGLVVTLVTDDVLFPSGQAVLSPLGLKVVDAIAPVLAGLPHDISVEGHTDDVPVSGTFASNWELSAARATSVVRHLVDDRVAPRRLSATGYADQRPMVAMDSDAHRARNRRVEVVVLAAPTSIDPDLAPDVSLADVAPTVPAIVPTGPGVVPDLAASGGHP